MVGAGDGVTSQMHQRHRAGSDSQQVFLVASDGTVDRDVKVNSAGQLEVDVAASVAALSISNALVATGTSLGSGYTGSTSVSADFILDSIECFFSVSASRTITVTSKTNGVQIYRETTSGQHVELSDINQGYNSGDEIEVVVTASAGTIDLILKVRVGAAVLTGTDVTITNTPSVIVQSAPPITFADSSNFDAFGRLRVANPMTLFDSKQIYDNQPFFWDELLETGAGITSAHSANRASTILTSTLNTAGKFTRQTFERFNYQPGKGQSFTMTGIIDASGGGIGVQRRIGMFDDNDGLLFEMDNGVMSVACRSNVTGTPTDTAISQSAWNIDKMDGTGPSGFIADWTKTHIFYADFEWLGVGRVRFCLILGGVIHVVHEFLNANIADSVYMSTPNLPLRYQMITTGSSPVSTLECLCASVVSNGGISDLGVVRHKGTAGAEVTLAVVDTLYAIVGLRLRSTNLGAIVTPISVELAEEAGSRLIEWLLLFNPTVAGSPSWSDITNANTQGFLGATANTISSQGIHIGGSFFTSSNKGGASGSALDSALKLGASINGTRDELVLAARIIDGTANARVQGAIIWREMP